MARLSERAQLVTDPLFTNRVVMAGVAVALEVITEDQQQEYSPMRMNLASAMLSNPMALGGRLTAVVVADQAVADLALKRTPSDAEIAALDTAIVGRLRNAWNALSGITGPASAIPPT